MKNRRLFRILRGWFYFWKLDGIKTPKCLNCLAFGIRVTVIKKKKTIRIFESREEEHPCTYILRDVTENSVNFDESQKHNVLN